MPLADHDAYKRMMATPQQVDRISKQLTSVAGIPMSFWRATGIPGQPAIPGAAAVPDYTTVGAITIGRNVDTLMALRSLACEANASESGLIVIADRLAHMGGLSGTVTTAQTVNVSAPSTRGPNAGIFAAFEVYTQIGTTATTISASYTDQDENIGITSPSQAFGGTGRREAGLFLPMSLASGDNGVISVASATVLATTGTAGSFGVTLYRPVLAIPFIAGHGIPTPSDPILCLGGFVPPIYAGSCLFAFAVSSGATGKIIAADVVWEED